MVEKPPKRKKSEKKKSEKKSENAKMDKYQQFHFGRAQSHFQTGNTSHALRHLRKCNTRFGAEQSDDYQADVLEPPRREVGNDFVDPALADGISIPEPVYDTTKWPAANHKYEAKHEVAEAAADAYVKALTELTLVWELPTDLQARVDALKSDITRRAG